MFGIALALSMAPFALAYLCNKDVTGAIDRMLLVTLAAALLKPRHCTHCRIVQEAKIEALRLRLRRKATYQRWTRAIANVFAW